MSAFLGDDSFDRLRKLDSSETRSLVYGAVKKVYGTQEPYILALCGIKSKVIELIEASSVPEEDDSNLYIKMLAAAKAFAENELTYHQTFELSKVVLDDTGSSMSLIALHALFSICLEQNIKCYESFLELQKILLEIEGKNFLDYSDPTEGQAAWASLVSSYKELVPVSNAHADASEEYIKTLEFVIDDTRSIN